MWPAARPVGAGGDLPGLRQPRSSPRRGRPGPGPGDGPAGGQGRQALGHDRPHQARGPQAALHLRPGGDQGLPVLPLGGGRPDPQDHPLDLGRPGLPQGQAHGQRRAHGQQLLRQHPRQRAALHLLPHRLRLEGQELRLHRREQGGLPRVPRADRDLQETPGHGGPARQGARGVPGRRPAVPAPRVEQGGAERRSAHARELRGLPLLRRRRRHGEARRPGLLDDQTQQGPRRPHGGRRQELRLHALPHHERPPGGRPHLLDPGRHRAQDPDPGRPHPAHHLRVLPHGHPPQARGEGQRPHGQGRLPVLPHPRVRPGAAHQDALGLVHGRQEEGRQAV